MKIDIDNNVNKDIITEIIRLEWEMFNRVNNIGGRAECQNEKDTFFVMRYSNYFLFSTETLQSCLRDFKQAKSSGRNLIEEKYAYMMEYTDNDYYTERLRDKLPKISNSKLEKIKQIVNLTSVAETYFKSSFPHMGGRSRNMHVSVGSFASFYVYLICELKTYSEETLHLYLRDIEDIVKNGENPSVITHEVMVRFYGYNNLAEAEQELALASKD